MPSGDDLAEQLVILMPVYNDWEALGLLVARIGDTLHRHALVARLVIVDDGSTSACEPLSANNASISAIELAALPVLLTWPRLARPNLTMRCAMAMFAAIALVAHPLLQPSKLAVWPRCWTQGATPAIKDRLATPRLAFGEAHWQDLARVGDYLRSRGTADGDVLSWDDSSHPLFVELGISPSSRFIHAAVWLRFFAGRQGELLAELERDGPRFVVTDLTMVGVPADAARDDPARDTAALPDAISPQLRQEFPWRGTVVFRAGRYLVHEFPASPSN